MKYYFTHTKLYKEGVNIYYKLCIFEDHLREEEREVNHHGRVRQIGEEDENEEEHEIEVMKNNWVGNAGELGLDLISRREDVQVCHFTLLFLILYRCTTGCCTKGTLQKLGHK